MYIIEGKFVFGGNGCMASFLDAYASRAQPFCVSYGREVRTVKNNER